MNKDEVIKDLIDMAKNGANNPLDAYCDSCSCLTCPFHSDENGECPDELVGELIGRLIKAEEHQETNLEHWYNSFEKTPNWAYIALREEAYGLYKKSDAYTMLEWLLSPYEEPKTKYKLSKFEHDLLKCYHVSLYGIKDFWILEQMQDKGYFKGIPTDIPIKDVLDNCEVIEDE